MTDTPAVIQKIVGTINFSFNNFSLSEGSPQTRNIDLCNSNITWQTPAVPYTATTPRPATTYNTLLVQNFYTLENIVLSMTINSTNKGGSITLNNFSDLTPNVFTFNTLGGSGSTTVNDSFTPIACNNRIPTLVVTFNTISDGNEAFSVQLTFTLTLTYRCEGINLETGFCIETCTSSNFILPNSTTSCYNDYFRYCLGALNEQGQYNIDGSDACFEFFSQYLFENNPIITLDSALQNYCSSKYSNFAELFNNNPNLNDQQICACNMPTIQYDNLQTQVSLAFPGLTNLGLNKYCFLPQCASSTFKNVNIDAGGVPKNCGAPNCINIAQFNNQGTFNGKVVINQSTTGCANITNTTCSTNADCPTGQTCNTTNSICQGPTPSPSPSPSPTPSPTPPPPSNITTDIIIFVVVLFVVLLIGFGLYYLLRRR